jgi:hypothetical protein
MAALFACTKCHKRHPFDELSDVKQAVKTSTKIKWQNRWTISESGRQLYDLIPMVGNANRLHIPVSVNLWELLGGRSPHYQLSLQVFSAL